MQRTMIPMTRKTKIKTPPTDAPTAIPIICVDERGCPAEVVVVASSLSEVVNPKLVTGICSLVVVVMDDDVVGAVVIGTKHGVCVQWRGKKDM